MNKIRSNPCDLWKVVNISLSKNKMQTFEKQESKMLLPQKKDTGNNIFRKDYSEIKIKMFLL